MCALAALVCSPGLVLADQPYNTGAYASAPAAAYPAVNPNQQVADQIAGILSAGGGLDGHRVYVEYAGGIATLRGQVGNNLQRSRAVALAGQVAGVHQVHDQLQVLAPAAPVYSTSGVAQAQALMPGSYGGPAMQMAPQMLGQVSPQPPAMEPTPQMPVMPTAVDSVNYNLPYVPSHAWPSYAPYPNYAALTYPTQYSPTVWPYIGPFYPYPQVPLGWRKVELEWDDGWWFLDFKKH
jgi:hypothetical protein